MIFKLFITILLSSSMLWAQAIPRGSAGISIPVNAAPLPLMEWVAWPIFTTTLTDADTRAIADAMVSNGLLAAGYQYLLMDSDGWMKYTRDNNGNLQTDPTKFPNGMAALITYIHGKGLKAGMYLGAGTKTCAGYMGSFGYELKDAALLSSWGADLIKLDAGCYNPDTPAHGTVKMAQAIAATGRNIVLTTGTADASDASYFYAAGAQSARIGIDMGPTISWALMSAAFTIIPNVNIGYLGGPNHWLDLDATMVGEGSITDTQGQTGFALWAIQGAPLLFGADIRASASPSATTISTLTNSDIIAVDQDALGIVGAPVSSVACGSFTCEVWVKPLTGTHTCAIAMFNRDTAGSHDITATFSTIAAAYPQCGSGPFTTTRDLWAHSSLGTLTTSYTATSVPAYGNAMIKVAP